MAAHTVLFLMVSSAAVTAICVAHSLAATLADAQKRCSYAQNAELSNASPQVAVLLPHLRRFAHCPTAALEPLPRAGLVSACLFNQSVAVKANQT